MEVHDEWTDVPRVSAFYGIVISMYFREDLHPGRPHFHAAHAESEATFDIESLEVIVGRLPRREKKLVRKWRYCTRTNCGATGAVFALTGA